MVLGLCGNAVAIDVLQGQTVTLTGTVVDNNSLSTIIGTLIIDAGADVTWAGRGIINGDRDFEAGAGAEIIMNGDRFTVNGTRLGMGTGKDSYLFVNSGYLSVNDFMLGDDPGGVHRVYVNGGTFRVRGDVVELHPSYESFAVRFEFFGDQIEHISYINPISAETLAVEEQVFIYPAEHYIMPADKVGSAVESIRAELDERLQELRQQGKLLEAQRLQARTMYDLEMILEIGYCSGVENYSRHLAGLPAGARPYTLIDIFDFEGRFIIEKRLSFCIKKGICKGGRLYTIYEDDDGNQYVKCYGYRFTT